MNTAETEKKACTKCGERERAGKHAWCRECQAGARLVRRMSNGVSNLVSNDVQRPVQCPTCPTLRRELENLRQDVARLKGELAEARRPAGVMRTAAEVPGRIAQVKALIWIDCGKDCGGPGRCRRLYHTGQTGPIGPRPGE